MLGVSTMISAGSFVSSIAPNETVCAAGQVGREAQCEVGTFDTVVYHRRIHDFARRGIYVHVTQL